MNLLAFDPGDTTGWAFFADGMLTKWDQAKGLKSLLNAIKELPTPDVIVVEDYRIRPGVNHSYSRVNTIQIIGALKAKALETNAKFILQEPSIKPIGYKWMGMDVPKDHSVSHETDAMAHGYYYLVRTNVRQPWLIEQAGKNDSKDRTAESSPS